MEIKFKLLPPTMPNFITYEMPPARKQDGFKTDANSIPVRTLTRDEAMEYGELMKNAFIDHWADLTKNK